MDKTLRDYAARSAPRYTSYPTAPHFTDVIDSASYADWLRCVPDEVSFSLYAHIPFCRSICHYCGCHTKATRQEAPVRAYARTLLQEIDLVTGRIGQGRPLKHLHWGGGTPSLLPHDELKRIASKIYRYFDISPTIEHAIELDPRTVDLALADLLAEIGVNRVSLGIQDFSPKVQSAIGRIQSYNDVGLAVANLRAAGLERLNLDLMYGLPNQGEREVIDTIEYAVALKPDRIALFGYAHVPWMKKHQRLIDTDAMPGVIERFELSEMAIEKLLGHGYRRIGLDHFALPSDSLAIAAETGTLRRNFQGYTADPADVLVGVGVSSISKLPNGYAQNDPDIRRWRTAIESGSFPVVRSKRIDIDDRLRHDVIERLMCDFEADVDQICANYDTPPDALSDSSTALAAFEADGLVEISGSRLRVPDDRKAFVRVVASAFDKYLGSNATKHSVAV